MEMKIDIKETEFYEQSFEQLVFNVLWLCRRCGDLRPKLTNNNLKLNL